MRLAPAVAFMLAALAGCGYVGEPLPPALNIPLHVSDLRVVQRGSRVLIDFTVPSGTTEELPLKKVSEIELLAGDKRIDVPNPALGPVHIETPAAPFIGTEVAFRVRVASNSRRWSEWSDPVTVRIVDPITPPANIKAEAVPQGVRVSWTVGTRPGLRFRIVKQAGKEETVAEGEGDSWIDTATEYGKTYRYLVQAVTPEKAESEIAGPVEVTPLDTFAPAVPRGLTALASATAIELSWEPNAEPDFKTYRVYRAPAGGEMTALAEITLPAATDKNVEAGKTYRYAVSAVDVKGNESARSEPAESTLP